MPIVSFIIPVYNAQAFLSHCLESVQGQSVADIEIICVNDASEDASLDIINLNRQKDPRIKLIDLCQNEGAAHARNLGLQQAQGQYIRMLDADDFIPIDSTQKLLNAALENSSDMVRGGYWRCDINGVCLRKGGRYPVDTLINGSFRDNKELWFFDQHWTYLFSADVIRRSGARYNEGMANGEDVAFLLGLVPYMNRVTLIPETVYCYRSNALSLTQSNRGKSYYLNLFKLYVMEYEQLATAGYAEQVDSFMLYHLERILPKYVFLPMMEDLEEHEAIEVLSEFKRIIDQFEIEKLCTGAVYPWQSERKIPLLSRQVVILLANGRTDETYETLREYARNKTKISRQAKSLSAIKKSKSWRMTAPLRKVVDLTKWLMFHKRNK